MQVSLNCFFHQCHSGFARNNATLYLLQKSGWSHSSTRKLRFLRMWEVGSALARLFIVSGTLKFPLLSVLNVLPKSPRTGLGIELQYFCGTTGTASILLSIEKCQASKFGIEWPKDLNPPASVSQYACSTLVVRRSNSTFDWLYSCVLLEKHQITCRDRADCKYVKCNLLLKQIR